MIFVGIFGGVFFGGGGGSLVIHQAVDLPSRQEVLDHKYQLAAVCVMTIAMFSFKWFRLFVPITVRFFFSFYKPMIYPCKYCYSGRKHLHFLNQHKNNAVSEKHFPLFLYFREHADDTLAAFFHPYTLSMPRILTKHVLCTEYLLVYWKI